MVVGRWDGTVACEERRPFLRMGHTEASGERFCETSGCSPRTSMMDEP